MNAAANRLEFAPPPAPGSLRALGLAVVAHALLVAALTWGVSWKREAITLTAEAELWSAVPQQAAPRLVEAPPPEPVAAPKLPPPAATPQVADADIVMAREKIRDKAREKQRLAQEQLLQEQKLAKLEKLAKDKKALEDKKKADLKQAEHKQADLKQAAQATQATKRKEAQAAQEDAKKLEVQRQENIKRMAGLAGATGSTGSVGSTGTAQQTSGPSPSYGGRIRARIKPNIVFTEDMAGNPTAEVEVRTSPDGTIVSRKLLKTSGVKSWDEAVLKAIDKTEVLPRDVDGRVPPSLVISFRPKD